MAEEQWRGGSQGDRLARLEERLSSITNLITDLKTNTKEGLAEIKKNLDKFDAVAKRIDDDEDRIAALEGHVKILRKIVYGAVALILMAFLSSVTILAFKGASQPEIAVKRG